MKYNATRLDRHIVDLEQVNKFCKRIAELHEEKHTKMWDPPCTAESANATIRKFNAEMATEAWQLAGTLGYIGETEEY